jgi:hypothetical protein
MQVFTYYSIGDLVRFCPDADIAMDCQVKSITFEYQRGIEFMTYYDLEFVGDAGISEIKKVDLTYVFDSQGNKPSYAEYMTAFKLNERVKEDKIYSITLSGDPENPNEHYSLLMKGDNGNTLYVSNLTINEVKKLQE